MTIEDFADLFNNLLKRVAELEARVSELEIINENASNRETEMNEYRESD